jgi:ATP-dependent DNA helicase RecQ
VAIDLRRYELEGSGYEPVKPAAKAAKAAKAAEKSTVEETVALFHDGLSVDQIAERRSLATMTVENHIAEAIEDGRIADVRALVDEADYRDIEGAARVTGMERLKPIREMLANRYRYREIRFVVADLRRRSKVVTE